MKSLQSNYFSYYAITINNLDLIDKLKTIDAAYYYLNRFFGYVYAVSVERNELNKNIHYHALAAEPGPDFLSLSDVWNQIIPNDLETLKYLEYLKKDGNYKVYNTVPLLSIDNKCQSDWYFDALHSVETYYCLSDIFRDKPYLIKYINKVVALWKLFKGDYF